MGVVGLDNRNGRRARLGLIGLGWWGGEIVKAAQRTDSARVVACQSRSADSTQRFASQHALTSHSTVEDILSDVEVDGVVIATPHSTHADIAVAAAKAGKAVLVEKPMALGVGDARRMIEAAGSNGVALQIGHNRRRQAANRAIKKLLDDGDLGRLLHVEAAFTMPTARHWPAGSWKTNPQEVPLGAMTLMGIHMIDTLNYLLDGQPESVFAISRNSLGRHQIDDTTALLLDYADGPVAYLATSAELARRVTLTIAGSQGTAYSMDDGAELYLQSLEDPSPMRQELPESDPLADQLEEFGRAALGLVRPEVDGQAGLAVVAVLKAAIASLESRTPITVEGYL